MKVIVEGIESEAQLSVIHELGANQVQGYYLGRPTPDPTAHLSFPEATVANVIDDQTLLVPEQLEVQ
jgi:EAL domain-containing protein (putative c-di-GMP-specific phosphodiesterase class I)